MPYFWASQMSKNHNLKMNLHRIEINSTPTCSKTIKNGKRNIIPTQCFLFYQKIPITSCVIPFLVIKIEWNVYFFDKFLQEIMKWHQKYQKNHVFTWFWMYTWSWMAYTMLLRHKVQLYDDKCLNTFINSKFSDKFE